MGDYYIGVIKGDTRSLDYSSSGNLINTIINLIETSANPIHINR